MAVVGLLQSRSGRALLVKCALIAVHLIAEEGRGGEDGCHAPGLGDE